MRLCNPDASYSISKEMSERINIFRLILTVLVIYNHSSSTLSLFGGEAVSLDMPFWFFSTKYTLGQILGRSTVPGFFFISAILLYRKPFNWQQNMKRKINAIAVPYFILNLAWILLFFVLQQFSFSASLFGNPDNIIANWGLTDWSSALFGVPGIVPFLYPLWFLRDLFILNFFASLIWKLIDKLPNLTLAAAAILWFGFAQSNTSIPDLQSICFWIFGAYMVKKNIQLSVLDRIPFLLAVIVFFAVAWIDLIHIYLPEYLAVHNLGITIGIVLIFKICSFVREGMLKRALLKLSAYSFSIYLFHEFTTLTFRKIAASILPNTVISVILQYFFIPFAVVVFCLVLSITLKKIMPRFYRILTGGR